MGPEGFGGPGGKVTLATITNPVTGVLVTVIFLLFRGVFSLFNPSIVIGTFVLFFQFTTAVGMNLTIFGLVPVPPLSNSEVLRLLVPSGCCCGFVDCRECVVVIMFILVFLNILSGPLTFLRGTLCCKLSCMVKFPFETLSGWEAWG